MGGIGQRNGLPDIAFGEGFSRSGQIRFRIRAEEADGPGSALTVGPSLSSHGETAQGLELALCLGECGVRADRLEDGL